MTAEPIPFPQQRSLRMLVSGVLEETDLSDPREIASRVMAIASPAEREAIVGAAMANAVRVELHHLRSAASRPAPQYQERPSGTGSQRPPGYSSKVAAIRDAWSEALSMAYSVGGEWKRLAEFTVDDALAAAAERRRQADELSSAAERFEVLAKAIADAGAETAGKLSEAPLGWT